MKGSYYSKNSGLGHQTKNPKGLGRPLGSKLRLLNTNLLFFRRFTDDIQRPALGFVIQTADIFAQDTQ